VQAFLHGAAEGKNGSDGADPERQAGEEQAEATQAATHLATRQGEGEPQ
jgi:hypothetical protein